MLRFILGGIGLAAAGYGLKKYFENEENHDTIRYGIAKAENWMSKADEKVCEFLGEKPNEFTKGLAAEMGIDRDFFTITQKKLEQALQTELNPGDFLELLGEVMDDIETQAIGIDINLQVVQFDVRLTEAKVMLYEIKKLIKSKINSFVNDRLLFELKIEKNLKELLDEFNKLEVYIPNTNSQNA